MNTQMNNKLKLLVIVIAILFIVFACNKDKEDNISAIPRLNPVDSAINWFVWNNMQAFYLWTDKISLLDSTRFNFAVDTKGNVKYNKDLDVLLNGYTNHEEFFEKLIYNRTGVDKYSWITDNYFALKKELESGISKSNGMHFNLYKLNAKGDLLGVIIYVDSGSIASKANLVRGNIFAAINSTTLTISNYQDLLQNDTIILDIGNINSNMVFKHEKYVTVTDEELQENPIFFYNVYSLNSNNKAGYLIYNGFIPEFDIQLNQIFGKFKEENINELILDLRYNSGGSMQSLIYLASMIIGTNSIVLYKEEYNNELHKYLEKNFGADAFEQITTSTIKKTDKYPETNINSLNLKKLYVLTSFRTASASEMLIHCLKPYITVINVGNTTEGKFVGSITISDNENDSNTWALQPIIVRFLNSNGVPGSVLGIDPDYKLQEDLFNYGLLGNVSEPMLSKVMSLLGGVKTSVFKEHEFHQYEQLKYVKTSEGRMYLDYREFPRFN
jgi:carboxyl-terminal processing protease